jgi:hypothetical protein
LKKKNFCSLKIYSKNRWERRDEETYDIWDAIGVSPSVTLEEHLLFIIKAIKSASIRN